MARHMLLGYWFIFDEFDKTQEEMVEWLQEQSDVSRVKVIEGNFVKFKVTSEIDKEAIFQKHSQGSVFNEEENNQGAV